MKAKPPAEAIAAITNDLDGAREAEFDAEAEWYPGIAWTDWLMLRWIRNLPTASYETKNLIYGIQGRRLYKRVAAFSRVEANRQLFEKLDKLSWPEKISL